MDGGKKDRRANCTAPANLRANMKPEMVENTGEPVAYPCEMGYLPPEFIKKAEGELFETPERKKGGLQEIRNLISKENGLRNEWFNDDLIVSYLRVKKYRTQHALSAIKKLVAFIKKHPQYFEPIDEVTKDKILKEDAIKLLPRRDKNGCVILLATLGKWNPSNVKIEDYLKYLIMLFLHHLKDPMSQVNGVVFVGDYQHQVLRYIKYAQPHYLYLIYQILFECFPIRVKGLHALNPTLLTKLVLAFSLPLLPEKIKQRIIIHSKVSGIFDHVQKNVVPKEYGGELEDDEDLMKVIMKTACMPDHVVAIVESLKS